MTTIAPKNQIFTLIFISADSSFLLANAQIVDYPIVYCNEAFCKTSGYNRWTVRYLNISMLYLNVSILYLNISMSYLNVSILYLNISILYLNVSILYLNISQYFWSDCHSSSCHNRCFKSFLHHRCKSRLLLMQRIQLTNARIIIC